MIKQEKGEGVITSASGISASDLKVIAEHLASPSITQRGTLATLNESAKQSKDNLYIEFAYAIKANQVSKDDEKTKNLLKELKDKNLDEIFEAKLLKIYVDDAKNAKTKLTEAKQKFEAARDATADKAAKIAEFNKFIKDNNMRLMIDDTQDYINDKKPAEEGLFVASSKLENYFENALSEIDSILMQRENRLNDVSALNLRAELEKAIKELGTTSKPTPPAVSTTENEATKKLEAINENALAVKSEQEKAASKFDEAKKALDEAKKSGASDINAKQNALDKAKSELAKAQEKVAEVKKEQVAAATQKANAIAQNKNNALSTTEQNIVKSLGEISGNDEILAIISKDKATIIEAVKTVQNEIKSVSDSLNRGVATDVIKFNTNLATATRLAKLSNPYNDNLALASAINSLNGVKFASSDDSALRSVIREYTDRFKYDNNLWGTLMGAKATIKGGANPKIYGFTLGYDKAFDNTIVGGFMTYAKSKSDDKVVKNDADNYQFGAYLRSFIDAHEIDAKVSFGFGKNDFKRTDSLTSQQRDAKYDSKFASVDLEYGYVYEINEGKFIKPLAGVSYSYVKNNAFSESGTAGLNYNKTSSKTLSLKLGAEFRAYINDGSFAYIMPGIEHEIYKHGDDFVANFVGSTHKIIIGNDDKKKTYATVQTGVDFAITPSLSTNINFGYKGKSKESYYNGTVGVRYKF